MSDYSFLPHFITEDIYVIGKEAALFASQEVAEEQPETTQASPVVSVVETPPPAPVEKQPEPEVKPATPEIATEAPVMKEPEPVYLKPLPTEGNNLKHCLILVESDDAVLETALKDFLAKIMGAVKRSMDDVLLVNIKAATTEQIEALLSEQNHRHLIAFGTNKVAALDQAVLYKMTVVNRKVYLRADPLSAISTNVEMKKALWVALKAIF